MNFGYCPNCTCTGCQAINQAKHEEKKRVQDFEDRMDAIERQKQHLRHERRRELLQQGCMIWLLVNTAPNSWAAKDIMNQIAIALDISPGMVNQRRMTYAQAMRKRSENTWLATAQTFMKIPGTVGTELPDWCEKCGGMKTEGTKCRRKSCQ